MGVTQWAAIFLGTVDPEPSAGWDDVLAAVPAALIIGAIIFHYYRKAQRDKESQSSTDRMVKAATQPSDRLNAPSPIKIMGGALFADAIERGNVPPPGPTFINRFLHAIPDQWKEDWDEAKPESIDPAEVRTSVDRLCSEVLDRIRLGGAPKPVIQNAEHAVTINMTAFAVVLAHELINQFPGRFSADGESRGYPYWSSDPDESHVALMIRDGASSTDAALYSSDPRFLTEPGDCARALIHTMEQVQLRMATKGAAADAEGTLDDHLAEGAVKMTIALDAAKTIAARRSS